MLRDKRFEDVAGHALRIARPIGCSSSLGFHVFTDDGGAILHVSRKIGLITQMPAAAHHRQVHAGVAALDGHGQDVDVAGLPHLFHRLLREHGRQCADLVTHDGGLLELQRL